MSDSPFRQPGDLVIGEPLHCLFCGDQRLPDGSCSKCSAWSAAAQKDETPDAGFPCPRCGESLEPRAFGRSTVKVCNQCHGSFVPSLQFSFLVNDYISGIELPLGTLPPPPPGSRSDAASRLRPVVCIACRREMDRVNFASRSGATVDVCNMHGIWLDAGELVTVLHFVRMRAELGEVPLTDQERHDQTSLDAQRAASDARMNAIDARAENIATDLRFLQRRRPWTLKRVVTALVDPLNSADD